MIYFEQISCGSDCTGPYRVTFTPGMTVRQFVKELLEKHPREWGSIGIFKDGSFYGEPLINYKQGVANEQFPEEYLDRVILKVEGHGGWSRSDFQLVLEDKNDY